MAAWVVLLAAEPVVARADARFVVEPGPVAQTVSVTAPVGGSACTLTPGGGQFCATVAAIGE